MKTKYKLLAATSLAIILSMGSVHAEGFFSNLFGGSKGGADLETLFKHVPADTAYLMANKKIIPEKVMEVHMQRSKDILELFSGSEGVKKAIKDSKGPGKFFSAWLEDYSSLLASNKIEETGFTTKANSVLYGYEMMPVMRIAIADKEKIMAMIKRAEEKSSYKVEFSKCGEFDCFESTDPKGKMAVAAVFLNDHIAISAFNVDKKDVLKKHLIGEAKPETAYTVAKWDSFLKENNYPGYGDGFLSLKSAFVFAKPLILENAKGSMDDKSLNGCIAVAENHVDNFSQINFGTTKLEKEVIDYEVLFKTSSVVSTALQTLPNDSNIAQRTENAIFDFGININFLKMRSALTQYTSFLIKSGEANKCPLINAQEIRKSMGGMALVMNMGLSQFSSVYASLSDIQLDKNMQPKKVDAVISLGSSDPSGLLAIASGFIPPLAALDIPSDGSVTKLPEGLIPSKGGSQPDVFLSRNDKAINIYVGTDKPALKDHSNETKEISFSSMDIKSYMNTIGNIMDVLPEEAKKQAGMADLEMLKKSGEAGGKMTSTTSANERGLAINYHLEY